MQKYIATKMQDFPFGERQGISDLIDSLSAHRRQSGGTAEQGRGDENVHLIDRAGVSEATQQSRASFDQNIGQSAAA